MRSRRRTRHPERLAELSEKMVAAIDSHEPPKFGRVWGQEQIDASRKLSPKPTEVRIDNSLSADFTIVEVFTFDRTGLLYALARKLHDLGLVIRHAKIGTYLDQVVDVFYVTRATAKRSTTTAGSTTSNTNCVPPSKPSRREATPSALPVRPVRPESPQWQREFTTYPVSSQDFQLFQHFQLFQLAARISFFRRSKFADGGVVMPSAHSGRGPLGRTVGQSTMDCLSYPSSAWARHSRRSASIPSFITAERWAVRSHAEHGYEGSTNVCH